MKVVTQKYGEHPRQSLDVYSRTAEPDSGPVIVFWHGGSWQEGDKSKYVFMGNALLKVANTVVIPNYRLYPEVEFPSFIEDGALAIAWVAQKYSNSEIFLMGHSAGAHIASLITFESSYLKNVGVGIDKISGFIGISGPYNFTLSAKIAPIFSRSSKELWNPVDRMTYSKPTLLIYGKRDKIVATSNSVDLSQKLLDLGEKPTVIKYPLFGHISIMTPFVMRFYGFPGLKREIKLFIKERRK